jgi:hypothetical protein
MRRRMGAAEPSCVSGLGALAFVQDPSDRDVQYIVEQGGRIRVVRNGSLEVTDFLDITSAVASGGERGLLGLAFPPDYSVSGRFYVNFTNAAAGDTVVARFKRSIGNPLVADPATRFDLRWPDGNRFITQPFSNHNGGTLAFGPDGYLYIGLGDGGSGADPGHRAQDPNTLLGKMLRVNVNVADSDAEGYDVPPNNPFVDGTPIAALHEIWAFGLRNPWKFSFDEAARRHGRHDHRGRRAKRGRKSTTSHRRAVAATTDGETVKALTIMWSPRRRPIRRSSTPSGNTTTAWATRSLGASSTAARCSVPPSAAGTSTPTSSDACGRWR